MVISMRFVRIRSRRPVGCMLVRPMPSCNPGIFMRCSVFPVASLLPFSYVPPGWPHLPCVWRRTVAAFRCPCSVWLCARHRNAVSGCRSFLSLFLFAGQADVRREAAAERASLASQLAQERKQPSKHFFGGLLLGLALFGVRQTGLGHVIELVARLLLLQRLAGGRHEGMQPVATFPQQLDIRRIAEQAFVTGGVGQAAVKAGEAALPTVEEHTLHFLYVQDGDQPVADGADNLAVLQGLGGVDEYTAEHLHVQVPVEHFHKAVVRKPGVGTQEHQGHLPLDGEQGLATLGAPPQFGGNQPPHFL